MGWTKRQIVAEAYAELSLPGYDFDIAPDESQTALRRLDALMATWEQRGIRIGYLFPASINASDLDDDSGLPDGAVEAAYLNLAIRLASTIGKGLTLDTKKAARDAFDALLKDAAKPIEQQLPGTLPRGAGNKPWRTTRQNFFPTPQDPTLGVDAGGNLAFAQD